MVATRRGARTGPSEDPQLQDDIQMLRKKPVRKAAAKTTKTAQAEPPAKPAAKSANELVAKPAAQGRTTRLKDNEITQQENAPEALEADELAPQPKPVTKRTTRSKDKETPQQDTMPEVSEADELASKPRPVAKRAMRSKDKEIPQQEINMEASEADESVSQPKPAAKRTTRSKDKNTQQQESNTEASEADESATLSKPVAKRATRSRKAESVAPEQSEVSEVEKPIEQAPRGRRRKATEIQSATEAEDESTPRPTLASRPTRPTRSKTAAAQPLSPKKITQVSKPRTRNAKVIETEKPKAPAKTRSAAAAPRARSTYQRAVSDENAEVPELMQTDAEEPKITEPPTTQKKSASPRKPSPKKRKTEESDASMSSRETTPSRSPGPAFEQPKDYTGDNLDAQGSEAAEEDSVAQQGSASEDELCGPKTPMKRSVRYHEPKYYTSAQKSVKRSDSGVPADTPPRPYRANGKARATPQTQKQACKTAAAGARAAPMTVAKGNGRAFERKAPIEEEPAALIGSSAAAGVDADTEEADEVTPTPAADETPKSKSTADVEANAEEADESTSVPAAGETRRAEPVPDPTSGAEEEELAQYPLAEGRAEASASPVADPDETIMISDNEDDTELSADSPTADQAAIQCEPDEQAIRFDDFAAQQDGEEQEDDTELDVGSPTAEQPRILYEPDETPINFNEHNHLGEANEDNMDEGDQEESDAAQPEDPEDDDEINEESFFTLGPRTPRPQTIPWQNLRQTNTKIPVDFDFHLADARSPSKDAETPGMASFAVDQQMELDGEQGFGADSGDVSMLDQSTMTLGDFIDVGALAEPTLKGEMLGIEQAVNEQAGHEQDEESARDNSLASIEEHLEAHDADPGAEIEEKPNMEGTDSASQRDMELENVADVPEQESIVPETLHRHPDPEAEINEDHVEEAVEGAIDDEMSAQEDEAAVPHYAFPTLSSRRKSLPAVSLQTPLRTGSRPTTSDGASIARLAKPFDPSWWTRLGQDHIGDRVAASPARPTTSSGASARNSSGATDTASAASPSTVAPTPATPAAAPRERFPRLAAQGNYEDLAQTVAAPSLFRTPSTISVPHPAAMQRMASQQTRAPSTPSAPGTPLATPQGRVLRSAQRAERKDHAHTVAGPARFHTPMQKSAMRPATVQKLSSIGTPQTTPKRISRTPTRMSPVKGTPAKRSPAKGTPAKPALAMGSSAQATPIDDSPATASADPSPATATPVPASGARYPRFAPRANYEDHASTVAAPSRFRTPAKTSLKRPATAQKPTTLRRVAFKPSTPCSSTHTPVKTPLKPAALTPGTVPMTPHPRAPLRGVTALVEVFTLDGASASAPFVALLQRLGAKTTKTWSERVTHVVFKDGSPATLQRVRLHNRDVEAAGKGNVIHCVNSRWVSDCDADGSRVDEDDEEYKVDVTDVPRGGHRRRKSMEPNALVNLGGNVVRGGKSSIGRKGSIGRSSLGVSPMKMIESPEKRTKALGTPNFGKENGEDDEDDFATPEYLKSPGKLVQQTAPMNRVKKLDLKGGEKEGKNRRLTFWSGGD